MFGKRLERAFPQRETFLHVRSFALSRLRPPLDHEGILLEIPTQGRPQYQRASDRRQRAAQAHPLESAPRNGRDQPHHETDHRSPRSRRQEAQDQEGHRAESQERAKDVPGGGPHHDALGRRAKEAIDRDGEKRVEHQIIAVDVGVLERAERALDTQEHVLDDGLYRKAARGEDRGACQLQKPAWKRILQQPEDGNHPCRGAEDLDQADLRLVQREEKLRRQGVHRDRHSGDGEPDKRLERIPRPRHPAACCQLKQQDDADQGDDTVAHADVQPAMRNNGVLPGEACGEDGEVPRVQERQQDGHEAPAPPRVVEGSRRGSMSAPGLPHPHRSARGSQIAP